MKGMGIKMIRILIIDDENIIRRGIRNKILRLVPEAEIVGEASDGEEALALTEECQPDIVITDIKMPKLDGLMYIENALMRNKDLYFIIISGHQDFAYAQKALRLGVCDYLLKPIEDIDLQNSVYKLIDKIDIKRKQQQILNHLKQKVSENEVIYKDNLFTKLVKGQGQDRVLFEQYTDFVSAKEYLVCRVRIERDSFQANHSMEKDIVQLTTGFFEETVSKQLPCVAFVTDHNGHSFSAVLYGTIPDNIPLILKNAIKSISEVLHIDAYIGYGKKCMSFENIPDAYSEACTVISQKIAYPAYPVISYEDFARIEHNNYHLLDNKKNLLQAYLKAGDYKNVKHIIDSIYAEVVSNRIIYSKVASLSLEIMFCIINTLKISRNYENSDLSDRRIELFFWECITYDDFQQIVTSRAKQVCDYMNQGASDTGKDIIDKIIKRLEEEYYKNIKLIDLADEYYINPSYLSQLFLQQTDKNFKQYISEIRIKNAKNLLTDTAIPIDKIAELVGYGDRSHFSKAFISAAGVTPAKYRSENSR